MTMFRVIPNTAISCLASTTLIAECNASPGQTQMLLDLFNEMGLSILIEEKQMTAATALTSCGIAFVLKYVQAAMQAGVEVGIRPKDAMKIWDAVFEAGAEFDIKPVGLGARDTLRLEMGFCLYGNDIDDTTSPIEAGLGWITKFVDGKNFTNRAMLEQQKKDGVSRKLVGFEMIDRGIPRHGYNLTDAEGQVIGHVTSGTMSPVRKIGIGMGYVKIEFAKPETEIYLDNRGRKLKAKVVKPPFRK